MQPSPSAPRPAAILPLLPAGPHWIALRGIIVVLYLIAALLLIGTLVIFVSAIQMGITGTAPFLGAMSSPLRLIISLGSLLATLLAAGLAEFLRLLIAIEHNTRITANNTRRF